MPGDDDVTRFLQQACEGEPDGWSRLLESVYRELHAMAHEAMRGEGPGRTLQTTALVHEAFLRLARHRKGWENRAAFFRAAGRAMRRILIDEARRRRRKKRGGDRRRLAVEELECLGVEPERDTTIAGDLEMLDRALDRLSTHPVHGRKVSVVELRYFVGMTAVQTAQALGISVATVTRDWQFARAWLHREILRHETAGG